MQVWVRLMDFEQFLFDYWLDDTDRGIFCSKCSFYFDIELPDYRVFCEQKSVHLQQCCNCHSKDMMNTVYRHGYIPLQFVELTEYVNNPMK